MLMYAPQKCMALFYGQNIKCKYITVMLYISMSCCIHQCYVCIYINVMLYTSMLYQRRKHQFCTDVTKTGNGEWGMGNGEWGMGNEK